MWKHMGDDKCEFPYIEAQTMGKYNPLGLFNLRPPKWILIILEPSKSCSYGVLKLADPTVQIIQPGVCQVCFQITF